MKNIFVILGPSGSGKGTQAALLSQKLGIPSLSMGQIFRDLDSKGDCLGAEAKKYWSVGKWVPDDMTIQVLKRYTVPLKNGFIIDGFPRSSEQPKLLEDLAKEIGAKVAMVVHFDVSDETSLSRMTKRLEEEKAAGRLREDQTPEIMKERLNSYHVSVEPILAYYRKEGVLERIDGEPPVEEIFAEIVARLKKRGLMDA